MRGIGRLLMALGAVVGAAVGIAWMAGVALPGIPWIVAVGLVKLTLIAAIGLIGAGATLVRIENRRRQRAIAEQHTDR